MEMGPKAWLLAGFVLVVILAACAKRAAERGFTSVDVAAARELIGKEKPLLLDVRTPGEFAQGAIKGATLIPVQELDKRVEELAAFKEKPILVYCHSGNRSRSAARYLAKHGFTKLYNLKGGIIAWNRTQ